MSGMLVLWRRVPCLQNCTCYRHLPKSRRKMSIVKSTIDTRFPPVIVENRTHAYILVHAIISMISMYFISQSSAASNNSPWWVVYFPDRHGFMPSCFYVDTNIIASVRFFQKCALYKCNVCRFVHIGVCTCGSVHDSLKFESHSGIRTASTYKTV